MVAVGVVGDNIPPSQVGKQPKQKMEEEEEEEITQVEVEEEEEEEPKKRRRRRRRRKSHKTFSSPSIIPFRRTTVHTVR